jgi:hydrogenase maturation factor
MALTRGANSKFPCPICLVPKAEIFKGAVYALRTTETMEVIYNQTKEMNTVEEHEKLLTSVSLRGIKVCIMLTQWIHTYIMYHQLDRMCSGNSIILTHTWPFHLTDYMHHILAYSKIIYG